MTDIHFDLFTNDYFTYLPISIFSLEFDGICVDEISVTFVFICTRVTLVMLKSTKNSTCQDKQTKVSICSWGYQVLIIHEQCVIYLKYQWVHLKQSKVRKTI